MGSVRFQAQPNPHVNGRVVVAEIVQQKKRIEILGLAETEGALKPDSRAFDGGICLTGTIDRSAPFYDQMNGHTARRLDR
jgi:hypothetical protein